MIRHLKPLFQSLYWTGILLTVSCGSKSDSASSLYFGGEIVNPTSNKIVLYRGEEVIDSAFLNAENHFEFRIDSIETGLYHFFHEPEMQYIFLEPGDSLQVRLNTTSFDESLAFSGKGEAVNNFLINSFLESELEEQYIRDSVIPLEPDAFITKMDQLLQTKLEILNQLDLDEDFSETALNLAKSSLQYKNYHYRESYPFWHRKIGSDKVFHELPADFYDYRNEISYNSPATVFLRPYYEFMLYHIGNMAYMNCKSACETEIETVINQLHFNQHRLILIDSLFPSGELRDNLFRTVAFDYLLKHSNGAQVDEFMKSFNAVSSKNRHSEEIRDLSSAIQKLAPGSPVPNLKVFGADEKEVLLGEISPGTNKEAVVFYFWSGKEPRHLETLNTRIQYLQNIHPEFDFIGIALKTNKEQWANLIGANGLSPEKQYRTDQFETFAHTLVVYHPYKSIICKDGKVVDGFANLNSSF